MENKRNKNKLFLIVMTILLFCPVCNAQLIGNLGHGKVTKTQLDAIFGTPISYQYDQEVGTVYAEYANNTIIETTDGEICGFYIESGDHQCFSNLIPGGIRIGDSFDKIKQCNQCKYEMKTDGWYAIYPLTPSDDTALVFVQKNIISKIQYDSPM